MKNRNKKNQMIFLKKGQQVQQENIQMFEDRINKLMEKRQFQKIRRKKVLVLMLK